MSKPDDIPQDIWGLARRIWAEMATVNHDAPQKHSFNDCDEIARAILAERERCAKIASPFPLDDDPSDYEKQAWDIRTHITEGIRGHR